MDWHTASTTECKYPGPCNGLFCFILQLPHPQSASLSLYTKSHLVSFHQSSCRDCCLSHPLPFLLLPTRNLHTRTRTATRMAGYSRNTLASN
jgi:hypothetical protein